jgi:hypothetical protein
VKASPGVSIADLTPPARVASCSLPSVCDGPHRGRSAAGIKLPPLWRVAVREHTVARWRVPAREVTLPAVSAEGACERVVLWAHSDAGVPPWRPYVRESMTHATAEPPEATVHKLPARGEQLRLRLAA